MITACPSCGHSVLNHRGHLRPCCVKHCGCLLPMEVGQLELPLNLGSRRPTKKLEQQGFVFKSSRLEP